MATTLTRGRGGEERYGDGGQVMYNMRDACVTRGDMTWHDDETPQVVHATGSRGSEVCYNINVLFAALLSDVKGS